MRSIVFGLALAVGTAAIAQDLITRDRFIADPSAHVFDRRVYLYTTDDSGNNGSYWNGSD